MKIKEEKKRIRMKIWRLMEERNIARFPRPVYGRIPNFIGAERAANRLLNLNVFISADIVKVNPDSPQRSARRLCLEWGKVVIMASPRLRSGFLLLDPKRIPPSRYDEAVTIRGAFRWGDVIKISSLPKIDLMITGSVAVSSYDGARIGKGGGYAELEYGILREYDLMDEDTPIVTTVHDVQVIDRIPKEPHDLTVDYILTPTRALRVCRRGGRPVGILWDLLSEEKIAEIPILRELYNEKTGKSGRFSRSSSG